MAKKKRTSRKPKGRKRIYGFSWTRNGVRQAIYENDFDNRADFMKERASFKKHGIRIKDYETRTPYRRG